MQFYNGAIFFLLALSKSTASSLNSHDDSATCTPVIVLVLPSPTAAVTTAGKCTATDWTLMESSKMSSWMQTSSPQSQQRLLQKYCGYTGGPCKPTANTKSGVKASYKHGKKQPKADIVTTNTTKDSAGPVAKETFGQRLLQKYCGFTGGPCKPTSNTKSGTKASYKPGKQPGKKDKPVDVIVPAGSNSTKIGDGQRNLRGEVHHEVHETKELAVASRLVVMNEHQWHVILPHLSPSCDDWVHTEARATEECI